MVATTAPGGKQNIGIAVAVLLHILVIGLLSVQWTAGDRRFDNPPMEVDLVAETAAQSTAPVISETPPAARLGDEDATDIAAPEPVPAPPLPEPVVRPTPAPSPKQVVRPVVTPKKIPPAAAKSTPKAAPKATPVPAPPHAASAPTGKTRSVIDPGSRYLSVDAAILLALGTEPGPTAGGTVGLGFGSRPWSAKAEVRFDASASTTTTAIAAPFFPTFSAVSGSLFGGAVVPCYQIALLRGCATLLLGGLSVTGGSTISLTSTARFFAAAGPRFEVALPIGGVAGLFFRAELLANFTRTEAFVDGVSMWRVPPVSGSLGFGGELHLPLKGATP